MSRCFFVNNLDLSVDLNELEWLFTTVGDVASLRIEAVSESKSGRQLGIIEMASESQAQNCVERFHGHTAFGLKLSVSKNRPSLDQMQRPLPTKSAKAKSGRLVRRSAR